VSVQTRAGTQFEECVKHRARAAGFLAVDRQPKRGILDSGDLDGYPDIEQIISGTEILCQDCGNVETGKLRRIGIVVGCKNHKDIQLARGMDELAGNMANWLRLHQHLGYDGVLGWQVWNRKYAADGRSYAVCELSQLERVIGLLTGTETP
jgi:hypothetical protein